LEVQQKLQVAQREAKKESGIKPTQGQRNFNRKEITRRCQNDVSIVMNWGILLRMMKR
jgi:hypothetical protein